MKNWTGKDLKIFTFISQVGKENLISCLSVALCCIKKKDLVETKMGNYVSVFPQKYVNITKNEFQVWISPSPIFRPIIRRDLKTGN